MPDSPTHFAWRAALGMGDYPPPAPKRGPRYAAGATCWLCGGPTDGVGWPRAAAIPSTFASHNMAAAQSSDAVCQPCAALAVGETWQPEAERLGLKVWGQASWRSFGHLFATGHHECPVPARWRAILTDPPEPPFLAVVSLSGQKNLIFRSRVAHSRDIFPVQVEDDRLLVRRSELLDCLAIVEEALAAGASREAVTTGRWHPGAAARAGPAAYRRIEDALRPRRERHGALLALAAYIAQRPDQPAPAEETAPGDEPPSTLPPQPATGQFQLL